MTITLVLIAIAVIAYGLGSINGAIITSRYVFHKDIRDMGSGNAGLTNFYRNFGGRGLASVAAIDMLKGLLAAVAGGLLLGFTGADNAVVGKLFATFCVVLGHAFPAYYGFRGGKGILCGTAAAFWVDWRAGLICLVIFGAAVLLTRYVSLGSILGAVSFPISVLARGYGRLAFLLALFSVVVILLRHASNIVRLVRHTESKFAFKKDITHKLDKDNF